MTAHLHPVSEPCPPDCPGDQPTWYHGDGLSPLARTMAGQLGWPERAGEADVVNHPPHYTSHPSGVECIQVTEHMGFNLGNAVKYVWRADLKSGTAEGAVEDLKKARWYIERELQRRGAES